MMKNLLQYHILVFLLLFLSQKAYGSLLENINQAKLSVVHIRAIQGEIEKGSVGFVDPKTGQLLTTQSIKSGFLDRYGAGIILNEEGIIATNLHIIQNANIIYVKLHHGKMYNATVLSIRPSEDLALIKIEPNEKVYPITLADLSQIRLGERIFNIGTSKYLNETISEGRVSALGFQRNQPILEAIQVNLELYQGDSGGPLFDKNGHLLGMMVAKSKGQKTASYAIPVNKIVEIFLNKK